MKNRDNWRPSKYVYKNDRLVASSNSREVAVSSRLVAGVVAGYYDAALRLHARGRLLDLGCGKVPLFGAYENRVSDVVCVDWESSPHGNEHVDIQCDLAKGLPFGDGDFQTIVLADVLEHVAEPMDLWREMARVLASDGRIIMNVPFLYWVHEAPHDYYRYTEFALQRFVFVAGLELISLEATGGALEVFTDLFAKTIVRIPILGCALATLTQWITLSVLRTGFGQRISAATRRAFPLGYFLVAAKPTRVS